MKKLLPVLFFLFITLLQSVCSYAAIRRYCMVRYATEYGWSKTYTVEVQFMTGYELNKATNSFQYDSYDKYCLIWWAQGQVSILKIKSYLITGYDFTRNDFRNAFSFKSSLDCIQVNSESEIEWQVTGRNYLEYVDPREN